MSLPIDRTFVLVASLVALALLMIWVAILAIPYGLLFVMLLAFRHVVMVCVLVCAILLTLGWLARRILIAALVGAAIAFMLAAVPAPARSLPRWAADLVDIAYYRSDLLNLAEQARRRGESPALGVVGLDGFGSLASGLALDPSGEIALPAAQRNRAWSATVGQTELGVESLEARHVIGNYYAWFHD